MAWLGLGLGLGLAMGLELGVGVWPRTSLDGRAYLTPDPGILIPTQLTLCFSDPLVPSHRF